MIKLSLPPMLSNVLYWLCIWMLALAVSGAWATTINVAPLGLATASSFGASGNPQNAIDGNLDNMWNAGAYQPQWIEVDLGATYDIELVRAKVAQLPDGNTNHQVSLNGSLAFDWLGSTQDGQWLEHIFPTPISARHLRIDTISSPSWVAWAEIEVLADTDVWVATTNSSVPGAPASNAIDGDYSTMWNAGPHASPWIQIDLGVPHLIESIFANVAQSPNGNTIHNIFIDDQFVFGWNGFTVDQQWLEHSLAIPIIGQRVRIETSSSPSWVAWYEILVHGEVYKASVPEPNINTLFALGLFGIGFWRHRCKKTA